MLGPAATPCKFKQKVAFAHRLKSTHKYLLDKNVSDRLIMKLDIALAEINSKLNDELKLVSVSIHYSVINLSLDLI